MPDDNGFNLEIDSGEFDPIEQREIDEALEETPEGNKKFKRLLLIDTRKQRKHCCRVTRHFEGRIKKNERRIFAWRFQLGGIVVACGILLPVICFLLVKYVFK